ncbi:cytochrome P450 4C1-like isoform X1 [Rhynchophorus ferrugineus]|uniref:cytochrome P450 4C1-like isoform X1 n=2 Tax=Rhynchophorus ferrugineus TaxID=354439 RepID=UPI003FCD76E1
MMNWKNIAFYTVQFEITILLSVVIFFVALYGNFVWKRRNMFIQSWNIPGPFNIPFVGAAYNFMVRPEYIYSIFTKLQEKYPDGGKFWFGSKLVYFLHKPEHIGKILGSHKLVKKDELYRPIIECIGEGLLIAPVEKWRKHRKMIMPSFHQKVLDQFVVVFAEKSDILNNILNKHVGKEINMYDLLTKCTLDTVCETAMRLQLNIQIENNNYSYIFDKIMLLTYLRIFQIWNHIYWIWNFLGYEKKLQSYLKVFNNLSNKVIQEKLEERQNNVENKNEVILNGGTKKRMAFLDYIMENESFTATELRDEVNMFLFAGTDTTSSTLSFVFAMLGMFQDVQDKVLKEVLDVIGPDRYAEPQDLPNLQYTERVIKETLRLFPVGAFFVRSVTEDTDVGDFVIPKFSTVYFGVVYIHRNAKYWPNPLNFDPDRFLPEEVAKRHPCCYIPFSYGPRNCIGKNYAMMNMKVLVSTVLRKFKIHCAYKRIEDIKLKTNIVLRFRDGAKVSVTPRIK